MKPGSIFRYRADLRSLSSILIILAMSLVPFFVHLPLWLLLPYAGLVLYAHSYAPYAQHNHGHLPAFRWKPLNWLYDFLLTQCTGYPTALWELHHVRGHHRQFLKPEHDVAGLLDLKTGQVMPRWWYALRGNLTIHRDSIRIGLAERREGRKSLLPRLLIEVTVQLLLSGLLLAWNPGMAILFFIIPNLTMAWFIWWESYQHHLGVPTNDAYDGSVTILDPWFNFQAFNIGHHTAHHEKPTLHWSLLPARTEAIRARIAPVCIQENYHFFARPNRTPEAAPEEARTPWPVWLVAQVGVWVGMFVLGRSSE